MRSSILFLIFSFLYLPLFGQDEPILLINPSFEGVPAEGSVNGNLPNGWYDCGFPGETVPDIHPKEGPGAFQVTKEAFHGKTYIGLVVRENETWEMISQRLASPLQKGKCYEFSMSLCRSELYVSPSRVDNELKNYTTPAKLRIWGGSGYCNRAELLAESSLIVNTRWLGYNFRFEPKQTHTYIVFEAFYKTPSPFPYNGNVLLDNASAIIPVPCEAITPEVPEEVAENTEKPKNQEKTGPVLSKPSDTTPVKKPKILKDLEDPTKLTKGQTIRIDQLYFAADSSTISKNSYPVLEEVYDFLKNTPEVIVEIGGHTNGIPSHEYCDRLSSERAKAIVDYLQEKGIPRSRLQYKGYGKRNPIDTNKTTVGRKKNQRVEIKILSVDG
jgi:outer membrane protein OmpA-like peptidoglycan-associated protein